MNDIHKYISSIHQLKLLNACRLFLQIIFISEITNVTGDTIICDATIGNRTALSTSKYKWSNQKKQQSDMAGLEDCTLNMHGSDVLSLKNNKKLRQWKPKTKLAQQYLYYVSPLRNELYKHTKDDSYIRWMLTRIVTHYQSI